MRWRQKNQTLGEVRIIRKFLFFPKCINGVYRWLEYATYKQKCTPLGYDYYWYDVSWEDL